MDPIRRWSIYLCRPHLLVFTPDQLPECPRLLLSLALSAICPDSGVTFLLLSASLSGGDQSGNPGMGWLLNNNTILYNSPRNLFFFPLLSHSNRVCPITKLQKSFSILFISNCVTNGLGNGISINHKLHKLHCYKYQLNKAQMVNPTMLSVNVWTQPSSAASLFESALLVSDSDHFQQKLPVLFPWLVSCY